jgi:hypothetical protein
METTIVSAQQFQQPLNPLVESLITCHNLEHPRSVTRRIRACLTLAGAAAAVLGLAVNQPRGDLLSLF